jgi:hypothetical protein
LNARDSAESAFAYVRESPSLTGRQDAGRAAAERRQQALLLRDIFGNPFRPARCDPAVLTADAVALANAAYGERALPQGDLDGTLLRVLADALEEAGCADESILTHLHSPGPHVRGCWALDLVLGKE